MRVKSFPYAQQPLQMVAACMTTPTGLEPPGCRTSGRVLFATFSQPCYTSTASGTAAASGHAGGEAKRTQRQKVTPLSSTEEFSNQHSSSQSVAAHSATFFDRGKTKMYTTVLGRFKRWLARPGDFETRRLNTNNQFTQTYRTYF